MRVLLLYFFLFTFSSFATAGEDFLGDIPETKIKTFFELRYLKKDFVGVDLYRPWASHQGYWYIAARIYIFPLPDKPIFREMTVGWCPLVQAKVYTSRGKYLGEKTFCDDESPEEVFEVFKKITDIYFLHEAL